MLSILKNISIIGIIFSVFLSVLGFGLVIKVIKDKKYDDKLVSETPLLKYSIVLLIGVILSAMFGIFSLILNMLRY